MSMLDEIDKFMLDSNVSIDYRTVNLGGKKLYIEGIRGIVKMDNCEMCFQMNKTMLLICGDRLKVEYLDKTTCILAGLIKSVVAR